MSSVTLFDRQEEVRSLESRLIKALTLARLGGGALTTQDGRFKVRRMLGRGASGVVCAAEDTKMERELAFKLYPGLADDRLAEGVRAEARALAKLKHPNVVTVHDFDASVLRPGEIWCFYVSMELLGGPSLRRWLAEGQDVGRAIEMFCQAGDGLAAAHAAGLVHRDVKPENVMLDGKTPKIVDFGLARDAVVTTGLAAADAHQRAIVGTLAYMAPEALEGRADARSDVFSFAAAVWEACYGEFPYAIDTLDPAARRRIAPPSRRGALPEGLFGCLSRALRGDPRERTGSIAELVAELRSLVPIVDEMVAARARAVAGAGSTMSAVVPIAAASARAPARRAAGAAGTLLSFVLAGGGVAAGGLWAAGFWETGGDVVENVEAAEGDVAAPPVAGSVAEAPVVAGAPAPTPAPAPTVTGGPRTGEVSGGEGGAGGGAAAGGAERGRCSAAEAFAGAWSVETVATKDTVKGGIGIRGRYELGVQVDGVTCEVAVDVAKIGMGNIDLREHPRRARTKGVIEGAKGGVALVLREVTLKGDGSAPMVYSMRIRRAKGGLVGTFAGRGGGRELSGTLEGRAR